MSAHPNPDHPSESAAAETRSPVDIPAGPMHRRWWLGAAAVGVAAGAAGFWWQGHASDRARGEAPRGEPSPAPSNQTGHSVSPSTSSPERLGEDFWALQLPQPVGSELPLATLRGRPLLINFWATWCPPCVRELPLLNSFYGQHRGNGLQMLGIAVDGAKPVVSFLERNPVDFPIALAGADGSGLARVLGNTGGGLPYTLLVDANGAVIRRQMGELQAVQLNEWAQALR